MPAQAKLQIPNNWHPRHYQLKALDAFDSGAKRAVLLWHRRAGKDSTALNYTVAQAMRTPGLYWHCGPTFALTRKFLWDNVDARGHRVIDQAFPEEIRKSTNKQEMKIELTSGSVWQCIGSDSVPVGPNPIGIVFSEWSLCAPKAWDYFRPILAENGGWAIFIYTMRGKNHGYTLARMAERNDSWYYDKRTVEDTHRPDGTPVISQQIIDDERQSGMSEDMIQQEFYCSPDAANPGAYYGKQIAAAWAEKRITKVLPDINLRCHTAWDLGIGDATAIWFYQTLGNEVRLINYYESSGESLAFYITYVQEYLQKNSLVSGEHYAPHDIKVREFSTGKARVQVAADLGMDFNVGRQLPIDDGIFAVRQLLPRCYFDEAGCEAGIACLTDYSKEWDDTKQVYRLKPNHNWASHGADAFRELALSMITDSERSATIDVLTTRGGRQRIRPMGR